MANCRLVNTSYLLVSGLRPISRKKNNAFQASLNALFFFLYSINGELQTRKYFVFTRFGLAPYIKKEK